MKRKIWIVMISGWMVCAAATGLCAETQVETFAVTPVEALQQLKEGNARFAAGQSIHPRSNSARREETQQHGQKPIASILSCSDSRVPLEILFDQGIGDVFVVRMGGSVAETDGIGSLEYAVEHLFTPLIVVMGHTHCGAVAAATAEPSEVQTPLSTLIDKVRPAVKQAAELHPDLQGDALAPLAIEQIVRQSMREITDQSAGIQRLVQEGKVQIVGAVYDIGTGQVKWLNE